MKPFGPINRDDIPQDHAKRADRIFRRRRAHERDITALRVGMDSRIRLKEVSSCIRDILPAQRDDDLHRAGGVAICSPIGSGRVGTSDRLRAIGGEDHAI